MLYEIGSYLFRVGIAVTIAYFAVYTLAVAGGLPIPSELVRSHALISAIQGNLRGFAVGVGVPIAAGVGIQILLGLVSTLTGRQIELEVGRARALAVFIGMYSLAFSGVMALTSLVRQYIGWSMPALAGMAGAITTVVETVTSISLTYYVSAKIYNLPTF